MQQNNQKKILFNIRCDLLICLFLVIATLAVYGQVRDYSFVNYDDEVYITQNPHVQAGLTSDSVPWAFHFATIVSSNWHPLTLLSHMLDVQLYGMNPGQHHMTNVIFHIANTLLLFLILTRMTGDLWQSCFVAALFALHPLHVESVAWISERKDVLSTFFWFLTMWTYIRYVEHPGTGRYLQVFLCLMLGLLCKPMLVTLPFVLLLIDYWPLKRFAIWEKLPLFFLAFVSSIVTIFAQKSGGAVASMDACAIDVRLINALVSYVTYLYKMIWPHQLTLPYPHLGMLPLWKAGLACLLLVSLSLLALRTVKLNPYFAVGWLWYLGTLVPVIGLIQVGSQSMADRYTYVPLIGIFIIIAWGFPDLLKIYTKQLQNKFRKFMIVTLAVSIISGFMFTAWMQVQYWRNSVTLFRHSISINPDNALANNNLALGLFRSGKINEAVRYYSEALRLDPEFLNAHFGLGLIFITNDKFDKAIEHYSKILRINSESLIAHNNIGFALNRIGKIEEAIAHFQYVLRIKPDYETARENLDKALEQVKMKSNNDK